MTPRLVFLLILALAAPLTAQLGDPPVPDGNPITPEKALLGKALFWDEQLSATGTMACGSCHMPRFGGADGLSADPERSTHPGFDEMFNTADDVRGSPGVVRNRADGSYEPHPQFKLEPQVTPRLALSVINAAFFENEQFWDGRTNGTFRDPLTQQVLLPSGAALESQAVQPPVDKIEMGHQTIDWPEVAARIASSTPLALATNIPTTGLAAFVQGQTYTQLFEQAFGTPEVTPARIGMAIATYERTLISNEAPIDEGGLTGLAFDGSLIFDEHCTVCHSSPGTGIQLLFSDFDFHNTGVRPIAEDIGRQAVTGDPADAGKFRTPSLRNASLRPRFFHNGGAGSLMEVVEFYDRGGDFHENQSPLIQPLHLQQWEKDALVAYMETFTDPRVADEVFPFDRPDLYRDSIRQPTSFGTGTPGTGLPPPIGPLTPIAIALEPPYIQNPNLTFTVGNALGGASALFALAPQSVPAGVPYFGTTLYLDQASMVTVPVQLEGTLNEPGAGFGSYSQTINFTPSSIGIPLYQQWFVLDPLGPAGIMSASEAKQMIFF